MKLFETVSLLSIHFTKENLNVKPGVVNCQIGWWMPEAKDEPFFGAFEVNANVLTSMEPPFDPCMGTYQLRGMLCRIAPNPEASDADFNRQA